MSERRGRMYIIELPRASSATPPVVGAACLVTSVNFRGLPAAGKA
jgi:hypothetical protein